MKKFIIIAFIIMLMGGAILTGAGCKPAAQYPIEITMTLWTIPPAPPGRAAQNWIDTFTARAGDKVKINYHHSGTLLGGMDTIEGVLAGTADIGMNVSSFRPDRFPMQGLINLPHPYKHTLVPIYIGWDMYNKFKPAEFDGVKLISYCNNGMGVDGCGFYTTFPVRDMASLKGKEIRATGVGVKALEKLGATPVFIQMDETYEAFQKGIVEGLYTTFETIRPFKFDELIKYITPFDSSAALMFMVVNEKTYNSWPNEIKQIIEDISMETSEWAGNMAHGEGVGGMQYAIEKGAELVRLDPSEMERMRKLLEPLVAEWLAETEPKNPDAPKWLEEFNKLFEKYNAMF